MTNTAPMSAVGAAPDHPGPAGPPPSHPVPGGPGSAGNGGPPPLVFGGVLLAVAVVSGLVWGLLRSGGPDSVAGTAEPATVAEADPLTSGEFDYEVTVQPTPATDCAANSYGDMIEWFGDKPCTRVVRGLYTTTVGEARALVSVVLVTMPDDALAQDLKATTDTTGTGNVNDLVRDGTAELPDAPNVANGKYHSAIEGNEVTIVEAAFFGDHDDNDLLSSISVDAEHLSDHLRGN